MIDCLIIGYNEMNFADEVKQMQSMGTGSISYKDFRLGYVNHDHHPYRALDILTHLYNENKTSERKVFHNADVLWQVIMYLGTYLHKHNFSFDYINLVHFEKEQLRAKLEKEDIMAIAVTTTIYISVHPILEVVSFIRKYNRSARIIVGGPYISKQCEEMDVATNQSIFKLIGADFYINSLEGESTLIDLLAAIKGNKDWDQIPNIAYRKGEDYFFTPPVRESNALEENMIDYTLFPKSHIGATVNVRTSKSCPFSCAYCGFPLRADKYSYISVERVERELNALRDLESVRYINFIDDTFNIPKTRFKEILKMMIRNQYPFQWYSFYRCDFGDEETIALMKQAGCIGVFLGVESANDQMLQRMNKTARVKDYLTAIPLLQQAGITIFASTIIGFPGETVETAQETMDFIEETKPDFFRPQIWWSDPLTPIWRIKDEYGIKGMGFNWTHHSMDSKTAYDFFERTFLSVQNSIWVPDPGFNAYGMYYLLERGMTLEQVKVFLTCFNAAVKEQILFPEKGVIQTDLLESLRRSCRFDEKETPKLDGLEHFADKRYQEAESYWLKEFDSFTSPTGTSENELHIDKKFATSKIGYLSEAELKLYGNKDLEPLCIAAFGLMLSRLSVTQSIAILVASRENESPLPLRITPDDTLTVQEYVQVITEKIAQAGRHCRYAYNILHNPLRLKLHGLDCPLFLYGYHQSLSPADRLRDTLQYYPDWVEKMQLVFRRQKVGNMEEFYCEYREPYVLQSAVDSMGNYFVALLKMMIVCGNTKLAELKVTHGQKEKRIRELEEEAFNF